MKNHTCTENRNKEGPTKNNNNNKKIIQAPKNNNKTKEDLTKKHKLISAMEKTRKLGPTETKHENHASANEELTRDQKQNRNKKSSKRTTNKGRMQNEDHTNNNVKK